MWECKKCRRELEDEDLTCWSCGSKREDVGLTLDRDETAKADESFEESRADWESRDEEFQDEEQPEQAKKLRDFAERLSKNESLDSRRIKGKLVVCDRWLVVDRSLVEDILASGIFSHNPIYVCVYSSAEQVLVFTAQGLVIYADKRLTLFEYEKITHFPPGVSREIEDLFTAVSE